MMNRSWLAEVLILAMAMGCQKAPTEEAPADDEDVPYDGETSTGVIPTDVPPEPAYVEDAGEFTVDSRCCMKAFSIADGEDPTAVGRVRGNSGPLAQDGGVVLSRDAGLWVASACLPLNEATPYWYEFETPGDGGGVVTQRMNANEPKQFDGQGGEINFIMAMTMCGP